LPGAQGMKTIVTVEVTYPAPLDGSKIDDTLQFGVLALDNDGKVKGSSRQAFRFTGSPNGASEVTYAINDIIELPSQPVVLRVGVASQTLNKAGAIHIPVEAMSPAGDKLQIGPAVIGFEGPLRQAAVPPGALKDLVPFQPTTTRMFEASDTLRVFDRLFWASRDETVTVTLSVAGTPVPSQTLTLEGSRTANGRFDAALDTTLPLSDLPAGQYVLAIDAKLSNGQTARRTVAFEMR